MENESSLEARLHALVDERSVFGASVALVRNGCIEVATAGLRDAAGGLPVGPMLCSMQPLIAYAVLSMAQRKG